MLCIFDHLQQYCTMKQRFTSTSNAARPCLDLSLAAPLDENDAHEKSDRASSAVHVRPLSTRTVSISIRTQGDVPCTSTVHVAPQCNSKHDLVYTSLHLMHTGLVILFSILFKS